MVGKTPIVTRAITESEVYAAQRAWGEALVAISTTYDTKDKKAANTHCGSSDVPNYTCRSFVLFRRG